MAGNPRESPEEAAPRVVAIFLTEYLPGVEKEFELLVRGGEGPLKITLFNLQMETLIFGLHCLDRAVFALCGAAYRADFMDCALAAAGEFFSSALPSEERDRFLESFQNHYNTRQREYSKMKVLLDGEGLKGDLAWEYCKCMCSDAGVSEPLVFKVMLEEANSILTMMMKIAQTL